MSGQTKLLPQIHKLEIVGDGAVGKTCLVISHTLGCFPEEFVPTVFDMHHCVENVGGKTVGMYVNDTSGHEDYDRIRPLDYPGTNVFDLCFDVSYKISFENIKSKWIDVSHHCPGVPVLLVGCKNDLRKNEEKIKEMKEKNLDFITEKQGHEMAAEIGAAKYLECSALIGHGVGHVFQNLAELAMKHLIETETKKTKQKM